MHSWLEWHQPPVFFAFRIEILSTRLQRWSFFSGDAMVMFYFLQRCDVDYFWTFPTIAIAAIIFPNHRDRLFCDVEAYNALICKWFLDFLKTDSDRLPFSAGFSLGVLSYPIHPATNFACRHQFCFLGWCINNLARQLRRCGNNFSSFFHIF